MENNIAYVLCATDKVTKKFYGFYSKGDTFIHTTPNIWFAKFYVGKEGKGIKNALANCTKRMSYCTRTGHDLSWKVQMVSVSNPVDIDENTF